MDALTSTFHIDIKLIIAQLINFAIVLVLVYFVLGKPLMKMMHTRDSRIKEGLANADKAEADLENAQKQKDEVISSAKEEARNIVSLAHDKGKKIIDDAKNEGSLSRAEIIEAGKKDLEKERSLIEKTLQKETAVLVRQSVEQVLKDSLTKEDTERIIRSVKA